MKKNKLNKKINSTKNYNKSIIRRNVITLSTSFALMIVALVATILVLNVKGYEKKFMAYDGYYNSNQTTIDGSGMPAATYIKMADMYDINGANVTVKQNAPSVGTKYISIETKDDLYAFDQLCNTNSSFREYKYILLKDIDWSEGTTRYFDPISDFGGTFDGNGYSIKNLGYKVTTAGTATESFAMFLDNNGTIKKFGLIDPVMELNTTPQQDYVLYAAPICAINHGTIEDVFVRDNLEKTSKETPGMSIVGAGYRISGMVGKNEAGATFKNSYFAGTCLHNTSTSGKPDSFQEVLNENSGTVSNLFFYDESIIDYSGTNNSNQNSNVQIKYSDNKTYNYNPHHYGSYCTDTTDLCNKVTSVENTNWIIGSYYSNENNTNITNFGSLIDFTTPQLKKLDETQVSYDSEKKKYSIQINETEDFNFIWNNMKLNSKFSDSSMIYKLNRDINMDDIATPSYDDEIQATFTSVNEGSPKTIYFNNYNYYISNANTYCAYGVFPWFSGELSYINFVVGNSTTTVAVNASTSGVKAIGSAIGYAGGAKIEHVNVYTNISINNSIGKYFVGGIAGVIGAKTTINNSTVNGKITTTNSNPLSFNDDVDNVNGIAIGGAVGFVRKTGGSLDTVLSTVAITSEGYTSKEVNIGGVVGAGYFIDTNQLQNNGEIKIGTNVTSNNPTSAAYSQIHVAGVVGRFLGMYSQAKMFTNNGDVTLYQSSNAPTYLAGILNADIQTSNHGTFELKYKGKYQFWASSLTNGANININNVNSNATIMYTYGLNIKNSNEFQTQLSGIYNVNYRFASESTSLGAMSIDMNVVKNFAPVMISNNSDSTKSTYDILLTTVYNLRDIEYTMSSAITTSTNCKYTGCILADYVSYIDVRNEGNQKMTIDKALTSNVSINGLFYRLSAGFNATSIYNGGNIEVKYTAIVTGNIYASGICYANRNGFSATEIQKYNPSNDNYDKSLVGSINNCINNGSVTVVSDNFSNITFTTTTIKSANGQSILGNTVETALSDLVYVDGDIYVAGITSINESVITNTFNIGDLTASNYVQDTTAKCEINAAGISILNVGQFAYILNSANDGDIKAINMSSGSTYLSEVNASGITCRNDEVENNKNYSGNSNNPNSKQVISFTINYGSIYSYNYRYNITSTSQEPNCKSAGILAMGLCNVINVTNYGNIYGSETASGIFGIVYYTKFTSEVSSNIFIANTLNYGNVYMLERGYNYVHGLSYDDYNWIDYFTFLALKISTAEEYALTSVVRNTEYISVIGSVFAIVNFGNANNTNYIKIRYLISFDSDISISGSITGYPLNANPDVSTFYSAHKGVNAKTGANETDSYMGKFIQYAPLSSNSFTGVFVTNIDAEENVTTETKTFYGVFSDRFSFMQAIKGNAEYLDYTNFRTDIFISDYFEFVGAIYANEVLLDKIGWSNITYKAAAESFATTLEGVGTFVSYFASNYDTQGLMSEALAADTWVSRCDSSMLLDVTNTLISEEDATSLLAMLDYIFTSGSSSYSIISTEIRSAILEQIIATDSTISYSALLDKLITYANGYSGLLADSVLSSDSAGQYLHNYINQLPDSSIESILNTYCNYLKDAENNDYFTYKNSEQLRYDILIAMFDEIDDNDFYQNMAETLEIDTAIGSTSLSDVIKMYQGYAGLSNTDKIALYKSIIFNNTSNTTLTNLTTFINQMATDISFYNRLIELGYSKTSLTNIYNDISYNDSSTTTSEAVIDERVRLWNLIKNTDIFKNYINRTITSKFYDKATEYNNTYQSITEPHNSGAYLGDTSENRLSYLYTTDITPQVYFYGPYTNNTGGFDFSKLATLTNNEKNRGLNTPITNTYSINGTNANNNQYDEKYLSLFHATDNYYWTSNDIMKSRGGENSTLTYATALYVTNNRDNVRYAYPTLLEYDVNNEQLGGLNKEYTFANAFYAGAYTIGDHYLGFTNSGDNQLARNKSYTDPMIGATRSCSDWTGVYFKTSDLYMQVTNTGEIFSLNKAQVGHLFCSKQNNDKIVIANGTSVTAHQYRCYIKDSNGTNHVVQGDATQPIIIGTLDNNNFTAIHTLTNFDTYHDEIYSFINYELGIKMYTSTVSTAYHSTGRTGIYRHRGQWDNYFTWKQDKQTRVFTSQYIDYSINDLLNLDGYLTQYADGSYKSTDERAIINRLFYTYFAPDSSTFARVVAAALLERNMYDINYNADIDYLNDFFISSIYSTTMVDNVVPLEFLYQSYDENNNSNRKSVKQYLIDNAGGANDYKSKFIAYCTSNQSAYAKLILKMIELDSTTFNLNDILAEGEGSSTDPGAISINNVSSYDNLYFVNQVTTINSESLSYGMKFDEITFTLDSSWKKIYLYCMPTETSGTINVKLDSDTTGTDYVITSNSNNYIEITLNNNTSMTLTADNDVILYKVRSYSSENIITNETESGTRTTRDTQTSGQTNRSYVLEIEDDVVEYAETYLNSQDFMYSNLVLNSYSYSVTILNNSGSSQYMTIGISANDVQQYQYIASGGTYTYTLNSSYDGSTIFAYRWNNNRWSLGNDYIISKVVINYNISYTKTVTNVIDYNLIDDNLTYNLITNSFSNDEYCNKTLDEYTNYSTKYLKFIKDALYGLTPIDYSSTLDNPTYEGTASKNIIEILQLSETHTDNVEPEYCVPDFLELFITSSNSAFKSFIDDSVALSENSVADYSIVLKGLINSVGYYSLVDAINARGQNLTNNSKNIVAAAYLASDYKYILDSNLSVYTSKLRTYITYLGINCSYIKNNGTYDSDKFINFCSTIGYNLSTTGYGIYALASNQGKLNGQFIPDNLELDTMDKYYEVTFTYKVVNGIETDEITNKTCKLVSLGQGETEYVSNASWRGGESAVNKTTSVNYAFYKEMRQLEKSISTTVFDLTISDSSDNVYYGDIDLDNKIITYYIQQLNSSTEFTVENIDLAYKAVAYHNVESSIGILQEEFVEGKTFTASELNRVAHTFTVYAEDTTVHSEYSIIFKQLTTTLTMVYDSSCLSNEDTSILKTVTSSTTDTTITLNITSTTDKLRKGLNLEPYLSFVKMDGNTETDTVYRMNEVVEVNSIKIKYITISALSTDHRIKADGTAVATMVVSYKIPEGTYRIKLSICGNSTYVTYVKEASHENTINASFDGNSIFGSSLTANTDIKFGTLYNNIQLTDYNDYYEGKYGEFYLDSFEYSANATLTVTVERTEIIRYWDSSEIYRKYVYTISYYIVAEDGDEDNAKTYVHTLTELDPYSNGQQYASVYKDGDLINDIYRDGSWSGDTYTPGTTLYNQTDTVTNKNVVSLKYDSSKETRARVQFDRADANGHLNEPRYQITYVMDNLYTSSPYVKYTATDVTEDENIAGTASVKLRENGLSGEFNSSTETGYYELMYTYTNTGKWYNLDPDNRIILVDDQAYVEYKSTYNFPILQVNKLFSLDATLHSITFIDSYKGISAASTGMRVGPMRPTDASLDTSSDDSDKREICYEDQLDNANNWGIAVNTNGSINYHNYNNRPDYGAVGYNDYYIVGSIANAQLSNYAPTFAFEENAMIFQYVTARIRNNYGAGKQTDSQGNLLYTDTEILGDHTTTTYLYVPFTYEKTQNGQTVTVDEIFLVELASNGKTLTNIYTAKEFTSTGSSINRTLYQAATAANTYTFTYDGKTYTLNKAAFGKPTSNPSLYMDYIGSPVEDHFWYVSYVIYSENYIKSNDNTYVKYYHIALIDRSNNVYFEVTVIVPADFDISKYSTLYMLINGFYKGGTVANPTFEELAVGAYVYNPVDYTLNGVSKKKYTLRYSIQMLPSAYYYFNLDLPVGYQVEATVTNKVNAIGINDYLGGNPGNPGDDLTYEGAYLPPSSIVAQVVKLTLNVTEGATGETNVWGISSSDVYTRRATLDDDNTVGNAHTS